MPENTDSSNVYRFTVSPQPNSNMRFSFTPVSTGEITIDITVGPPLATTSSSNQSRAPLHYTSSSSSAVRPAPPYSLASSSTQRAGFPSQPQCKTSPFSETEPETDEELIMADQQGQREPKASSAKQRTAEAEKASASKRGKVDRK